MFAVNSFLVVPCGWGKAVNITIFSVMQVMYEWSAPHHSPPPTKTTKTWAVTKTLFFAVYKRLLYTTQSYRDFHKPWNHRIPMNHSVFFFYGEFFHFSILFSVAQTWGVQCHGACGPTFALGQRWLAYNVAPHEVTRSFPPSRDDADVQRGGGWLA